MKPYLYTGYSLSSSHLNLQRSKIWENPKKFPQLSSHLIIRNSFHNNVIDPVVIKLRERRPSISFHSHITVPPEKIGETVSSGFRTFF
ncbi:hypothetical protein MtrunA17_Chr4g0024671 [Medicago truncatula]|uniref:Uncharacterized protein n=1 Tax=Medicago truncatula TaxID=3880 RepID=A0A396I9K6_MEDTR|nr:hypothetical protein MtrunA17_Chr4g0024671 [Medicago truncatula]